MGRLGFCIQYFNCHCIRACLILRCHLCAQWRQSYKKNHRNHRVVIQILDFILGKSSVEVTPDALIVLFHINLHLTKVMAFSSLLRIDFFYQIVNWIFRMTCHTQKSYFRFYQSTVHDFSDAALSHEEKQIAQVNDYDNQHE